MTSAPAAIPAGADPVLADMFRRRGGFLLPHHGILGLLDPETLALYDRLYSRVALTDGPFSEFEKEYVWLAIIVAGREAIGTHHLRKYRDEAPDLARLYSVLRLVALVEGSDAMVFPAESWAADAPDYDWRACYLPALLTACAGDGVAPWLIHLAAAAVATCGARWSRLAVHLKALYDAGIDERRILEGLLFAMLPGGIPNFINACAVWQKLLRDGALTASAVTRAWAAQDFAGFGSVTFPDASP